ncbi:MAG: phospholipase D family protein [Balneolia bacterium]|nr:phospholipase D family protein [Balneolia bacterium]
MKTIERRNILDLIGRDSRRYRSCMLTSFSFDYVFFEQRVLPVLNANGISNTVVLTDGHKLEASNQLLIGMENPEKSHYSIMPVYAKGAFHPKMMLLAGEKHGLLLLGSGNLTSSGLSTNDEIWTAFQLNDPENENAAVIGAAWSYLKSLSVHFKGASWQKFEWIGTYAPWLEKLSSNDEEVKLDSINVTSRFIANTPESGILQKLTDYIPAEEVKTITVVSPYFDSKGSLLRALEHHFSPEALHCVVDKKSGLLPVDIEPEPEEKITFFDWKELRDDFNEKLNRLHAKLIHFKTHTDKEYLLIGSANATTAGMGSMDKPGINHEACILFTRKSSHSWLQQLQIEPIAKSALLYTDITTAERTGYEAGTGTGKTIRLLYAEKEDQIIRIYLEKTGDEAVSLNIENDDLTKTYKIPCKADEEIIEVSLKDSTIKKPFRLSFENVSGQRISNYCLVHSVEALMRGNPDPAKSKLSELFSKPELTGKDLDSLLSYVEFSDFNTENRMGSSSGGSADKNTESQSVSVASGRKLDKDTFNEHDENFYLQSAYSGGGTTGAIARFLDAHGNSLRTEEDITESEEQKLAQGLINEGEGNSLDVNDSVDPEREHEKKQAFHRYLNRLDRNYTKAVKVWYFGESEQNIRISPGSLNELYIGLKLISLYMRKNEKTDNPQGNLKNPRNEKKSANPGTKEKSFKYFEEGSISDGCTTIKGFLTDTVGKFLLLALHGYEHKERTREKERMDELRLDIFNLCMELIHFISWNRLEEIELKKNLILNCLHYIHPVPADCVLDEELEFGSDYTKEQTLALLQQYKVWIKIYENDEEKKKLLIKPVRFQINKIIYHRSHGFVIVKDISDKFGVQVVLERPGYVKKKKYRREIQFPKNCVVFNEALVSNS